MDTTAPSVFISYSHKDGKWVEALRTMLAPAERARIVDVWWDGEIRPSQIWRQEVEKALASARLGILLVSSNFLASNFIQDEELPFLLDMARRRRVKLLWVLISPCLYQYSPLRDIQAAHLPLRPLSKLRKADREEVLASIAGVVVEALSQKATRSTLAEISADTDRPHYQGVEPFRIEDVRQQLDQSHVSRGTSKGLQECARRWNDAHRDPGSLVGGSELEKYETWSRSHPAEVSTDQKEYLKACVEKRKLEEEWKKFLEEFLVKQGQALVFFGGVDPQGKYLRPPIPLRQLVEQLFQDWQAIPEWFPGRKKGAWD